jgi:O-antigen ligase
LKSPSLPADRILAAMAIGSILCLPFIHSGAYLDFDLGPKFLAWAILVFLLQLWICARRPDGKPRLTRSPPLLAFTAFAAVSLLAIPRSTNPWEGLWDWGKTALSTTYLWQCAGLIDSAGAGKARRNLAMAMAVFGLIASGLALSAVFALGRKAVDVDALYGVTGAFGHKNLLASILLPAAAFALFGALRFRGPGRLLCGISSLMGILAMLLLQTRSVWLSLAAAALAGGALALIPPRHSIHGSVAEHGQARRTVWIALGTGLILIAGSAMAIRLAPAFLGARVASMADASQNKWRLLTWRKSLRMAREKPWTGVGPGNWKIDFPRFGTDDIRIVGGEKEDEESAFVRPHNDFLWVHCETGIPGALLYGAFFLALFHACCRIRRRSIDPDARAYAVALFAYLVGYLVDASFSFPRERIVHSMFLMLSAASLSATPSREEAVGPAAIATSRWVNRLKWPILLLSAFWVITGWIRLGSEKWMHAALQARAEGRWQDVVDAVGKVNHTFYPLDVFGNPVMFYRGTGYYLLGDPARSRSAFEEASRDHPYHAHTLNDLGTAMGLAGEPVKAIECYDRALALRPSMVDPRLNGAVLYCKLGDYAEARAWLARRGRPLLDDPRWVRISGWLDSVETSHTRME